MDNWYTASDKDESADELLHMFWEFHDFRIIEVKYSASTDAVDVLFEYDDRELRILLRFEGNVQFYIPPVDFEVDWIFEAVLQPFNNQLRWVNCELEENETISLKDRLTFFQGDSLKWTLVDKSGKHLSVTDDLLHQHCKALNYETGEYEDEYKEFKVTPE